MFLRSPFNAGGLISNTPLNYDVTGISPDDYHINIGAAPATIQYVGGITASFVGSTTNDTVSLTSLTGGIAAAPQYGDLIIVAVELSGTSNKAYIIADFLQIADLYQDDTEDSNFQVGYKFTSIIPETSVVITGGSGNTADGIAVAIHVYRNIDQTTPFDVTSTTFGALNGAIPDPPAITPTTSGALIVVAAGAAHDATAAGLFTASYLSNFITDTTVALAETNDATVGMGNVAWTSGAYNPVAWTFTGTGGTAANWSYNSVTMALRPGPTITVGNLKSSGIWNYSAIIDPIILNVEGQQEYITSAGSPFSFTVPDGVKRISAVTIGGGGGGAGGNAGNNNGATGGAGGGLAYGTFDVTAGETLTVVVGAGGNGGGAGNNGGAGNPSSIARGATVLLQGGGGQGGQDRSTATRTGGTSTGTARIGGGAGGNSSATTNTGGGGGGAGGYSANGGNGGSSGAGTNGTGGGGGGGGATDSGQGYGGGGVGIVGEGTSGTGGALNAIGTGGSSGANGTRPAGGAYGGGGGACDDDTDGSGGAGGVGAVRLVWGKDYTFPTSAPAGIITDYKPGGIRYPQTIS